MLCLSIISASDKKPLKVLGSKAFHPSYLQIVGIQRIKYHNITGVEIEISPPRASLNLRNPYHENVKLMYDE